MLKNRLVFMQRVQQAAPRKYYFYVCGKTELGKLDGLVSKFDFLYGINLSRQSKSRRRKSGEAVSVFHSFVIQENEVFWVLLATEGKGRIHHREKLLDLRDKKSRLLTPCGRYQLLNDGHTWTWSMTRTYYQKFEERIHAAATLSPAKRREIVHNDKVADLHAERLLDQLYAQPGFREIRKQVGRLVTLLINEWKRHRPSNGPQPERRAFLHYVRFMS